MTNYSENDLIPFALEIINQNNDGIDTKNLLIQLRIKMNPKGEDTESLLNRPDDKFSQKVRNLKSHKTLEKKGYTDFLNNKFYITQHGLDFLKKTQKIKPSNNLNLNILQSWELSVRSYNALKNYKIFTISDLLKYTEKDLLSLPGFGKTSLDQIKQNLSIFNLNLGMVDSYEIIENENHPIESYSDTSNKEIIKNQISLEKLSINILKEWALSPRTLNALRKNDIIYVGDLLVYDKYFLLKLKNFGKKSFNELVFYMEEHSINFGDLNLLDKEKYQNWLDHRIDLVNKSNLLNTSLKKINLGITKSLFKDFEKFKNFQLKRDKIIIYDYLVPNDIEKLILVDIEFLLENLDNRPKEIFLHRYAYKTEYLSLENIGSKHKITRERVRQIEFNLDKSLQNIGSINKTSLIKYFQKYEFTSFHRLFPILSENFKDSVINKSFKDTSGDALVRFLENYCGVNVGFFKTPERTLTNFDSSKLQQVFEVVPSASEYDFFLEQIKENYGYSDYLSSHAVKHMEKNNFIKIKNNKVYPIKIDKKLEVANILIDYPNGLHWKKICELGNKSFTKNKWDLKRLISDHSLNMVTNQLIYLSDRGTHKLLKYCKELHRINEIIKIFKVEIEILKKIRAPLEIIYQKVIQNSEYNDLNFYDARAIIKVFGHEYGIYHYGKSGSNTIALIKDIDPINLSEKVKTIIDEAADEITLNDIVSILKKTNENIPVSQTLQKLVSKMLIFRTDMGTYLNFNKAINLCDKDEVKEKLSILLNRYEFITMAFLREEINEELGYNLSSFYYDTLSRILANENSWFYGSNYLSKKKEKSLSLDKYIKENYDENLSTDENFEIISSKVGISLIYFKNFIYKTKQNFNTDWIHQHD